jgi:hypothetical protein
MVRVCPTCGRRWADEFCPYCVVATIESRVFLANDNAETTASDCPRYDNGWAKNHNFVAPTTEPRDLWTDEDISAKAANWRGIGQDILYTVGLIAVLVFVVEYTFGLIVLTHAGK